MKMLNMIIALVIMLLVIVIAFFLTPQIAHAAGAFSKLIGMGGL